MWWISQIWGGTFWLNSMWALISKFDEGDVVRNVEVQTNDDGSDIDNDDDDDEDDDDDDDSNTNIN